MYQPIYRITPYLLKLISQASELKSWIEGATLQVAWLPVLQKEARIRSTHSSTSIEGNPLSLPQVQALANGQRIGAPRAYEQEVENYLKAMRWVEKRKGKRIEEKGLLQLHAIIMDGLMPREKLGKYKDKQNYVVNGKNINIYTPPSPQETPRLMKDLIDWLNAGETAELHGILVCAILHHRLVSVHPFPDGNGRAARALGSLILYQRDFDSRHIFSLDDYFAGNRKFYYQKIQQARELDDDLTPWIEYVAEGIIATLKNTKQRIEELQLSPTAKLYLSPRQEEIIRLLNNNPRLSGAEMIKHLKVSRSRINQLLIPLIKNGVVMKEGLSKATRYRLSSR